MSDQEEGAQDAEATPDAEPGDGGTPLIDPWHRRRDIAQLGRFPIPEKLRPLVAGELAKIAFGELDPVTGKLKRTASHRDRLAALRVLAQIDRLNMEQEKIDAGRADTTINVIQQTAVTQDVQAIRSGMLDDDAFQDFLRNRTLPTDSDPSSVRPQRKPGPLADRSPSGNGRSRSNGDGKGPD